MKTRTFAIMTLLLLGGITSLFAQEEGEECGTPDGRRVKRLLRKGTNRSSGDLRERNEYLRKALEVDPECAPCLYSLAENYFIIAKQKPQVSYDQARNYYLKLEELCPDHHSEMYFQLGLIYYGEDNYTKAIEYFQEYMDFNVDDDSKYADDYAKKYKDAKEIMPELKFYRDFFNNEVPFDPHIVKGVSTNDGDEYLPMLSPDNEVILFTRRYRKKTKNQITPRKVEELTMARRPGPDAQFDRGHALDEPFNVKETEKYGGVTISVDNREMFITVCKPAKKGYNNCDIYRTTYEMSMDTIGGEVKSEFHWSPLENLGPKINTSTGWEAQPSLSANGNTLYFATVRKETEKTDIYYSTRKEDGEWTQAKSIGSTINTKGNDKAPFIHSDSKTLYFSSDERLGAGGYDIFFAKQKEGSDTSWTEPENIGYPINTKDDEIGLIVSTDGKFAYFSSSRLSRSHGLDIYSFALPKDARPEKVKLVKGKVQDENGDPLKGAQVELKNPKTKDVTTVEVDSSDGKFAAVVNVNEGDDVVMTVRKDGYAFKAKAFAKPGGAEDAGASKGKGEEKKVGTFEETEVKMEKVEVGKAFRIDDIHYETNSAELKDRSKKVLDEFIGYLKENGSMKVSIQGHTDNVGTKKDNQALSQDRAFTVMSYLQEHGIKASRLEFKGFGESRPIAPNDTPEGRALNRRTEFKILSK